MPSFCLRYFAYCRAKEDGKYIGFTTEVQRNYILGSLKLSYNLIEACINSGDDYGMVFTFFWRIMCILWLLLKLTELLLPKHFPRLYIVFQAYRIRWICHELLLIVMLSRLSVAYITSSILYITTSLSLSYMTASYNWHLAQQARLSRPVTGNG